MTVREAELKADRILHEFQRNEAGLPQVGIGNAYPEMAILREFRWIMPKSTVQVANGNWWIDSNACFPRLTAARTREASVRVAQLGCPGLLIRVGKRGSKVWEVVVSRDRQRKRHRLGRYPEVSLATARRMASERKSAPIVLQSGLRVADLWRLFSDEFAGQRRAWRGVAAAWRVWAAPKLANVRLEDLGLFHGAELVAEVTRKSSPNRARMVVRYMSPMLNFAAGRGWLPGNPWAGLNVPDGAPARDRVLGREEW